MRKGYLSLLIVLISITFGFAQSPSKFNFQSMIRDGNGKVLIDQNVSIKISILKGGIDGELVFSETHQPKSNSFGIVNLKIGEGTIQNSLLSMIDWGVDEYFIKVEVDSNGGNNFTLSSINQLVSVPYALHATSVDSIGWSRIKQKPDLTEVDPVFVSSVAKGITQSDTSKWNKPEADPLFKSSVAMGITQNDTAKWNKLESDPVFDVSVAKGISQSDTAKWNKPEFDPLFNNSVAKGITQSDTASWNKVKNSIQVSNPQKGQMAYYDGGKWEKIPSGKNNQVLLMKDGIPRWGSAFPDPVVTSVSGVASSSSTAQIRGSTNPNGQIVTNKFQYGTSSSNLIYIDANPTQAKGFDNLTFQTELTNLTEGTSYQFRSVVITTSDTLYGDFQTFTTPVRITVTDVEGNVYETVTIGSQTWMKENLKTTKYRNGDVITTTTPSTLNIESESSPSYYWNVNSDPNSTANYGLLYTWYTMSDSRNVCPTGWHVPNNNEWTLLLNYLGGGTLAAGKIKSTNNWNSPNTGANNDSGFSAIPAGGRGFSGIFYGFGTTAIFWSTTDPGSSNATYLYLTHDNSLSELYNIGLKKTGGAIRCIKD